MSYAINNARAALAEYDTARAYNVSVSPNRMASALRLLLNQAELSQEDLLIRLGIRYSSSKAFGYVYIPQQEIEMEEKWN